MRSASERPSEPPLGERERLVDANDAAVCLAPFAMVGGSAMLRKNLQKGFLIFGLTDW
jgi:hypothetical protein